MNNKVKLYSSIIFPKNIQFVIILSTIQHKDRRLIMKVVCFLGIFKWSWIRVCTPSSSKFRTVFRSGLTIGLIDLGGNSAHRKITKRLLGSSRVGRFPVLINRCMFVLANKQAGSYALAIKLELIRFWTLPFGVIMWHPITQVNDGILAA